ncbi:MAG: ABC transporter permease [Candidatus Marinimicrobia bacterium]|nr:ABC transporter permease [Candidatus Neomarinimicrobiota bacterium]
MIKQMFKLIWNRRRRNSLMIIGIFISFFSLFLVMTTINYNLGNYLKPLGFDYDDVWYLSIDWKTQDSETVATTLRQLENTLNSQPEIISQAYSISYLFMPSATSMDDYHYAGKTANCHLFQTGDDFPDVLNLDIVKGRWFGPQDNAANHIPVVLNKYAVEALFAGDDPIGKIIYGKDQDFQGENEEFKVVGLIDEFRNGGEFTGSKKVLLRRASLENDLTRDFLKESFFIRILFRVRPGTTMDFEERLMKQVTHVARDWMINIDQLDSARISANKQSMIIPTIMAIICGFLIINVALGLFGMIWYNTNRRKAEIGLRRAMGSTERQIYFQIVGESLVLATFGMITGIFFAVQLPLLGLIPFISTMTYAVSILLSILVIYLITIVCALYPSNLAASLQPAIALHDE